MISTYFFDAALYTGGGYAVGWLVTTTSNASTQTGSMVGAASGLAFRLSQHAILAVSKHYKLEDYKVHMLKAATDGLLTTITLIAMSIIGVNAVALTITATMLTYLTLRSIDRAQEKWGANSFDLIRANDFARL